MSDFNQSEKHALSPLLLPRISLPRMCRIMSLSPVPFHALKQLQKRIVFAPLAAALTAEEEKN